MVGQRGCIPLLVLVQVLLSASALALDPDRSLTQYACRTWGVRSGFPGDGVSAITQTRDGFIWIGTRKGLVRFDGLEFKLFPLPAIPQFQFSGISALASAADGGLWFGIENGSLGYYRTGQGFRALTNAPWTGQGLSVFALSETRDGALWVGSSSGVFRQGKDGVVASFPEAVACISLLEDSRQRVWLGTGSKGVYCWQAGNLNPDLHLALDADIARSLAEDRSGGLWVATQNDLRCYDSALQPRAAPSVAPSQSKVLCDSHGSVWVGAGNNLYRWADGALASLCQTNGLPDDEVSALFEDRQGNLWIGGRNGLSLLSDVKLPVFGQYEGLPKAGYEGVCASAKGGLWAATSTGVCRFSGNTVVNYSAESGITNTWIKRVFEARNGDLYLINGEPAVQVLRDGKVVGRYTRQRELPAGLTEDQQGVLVSFGSDLFRIEGDTLKPYNFGTNTTPPFWWINNLGVMRDGTLLVASINGVFRIRDKTWERFGMENGLAGSEVLWVCEDEPGVVWAGLAGGLARIQGSRVQCWTREDGLFDNLVRAVIPDDYGRLWIHSSQGIFSVGKSNLTQVAGHKGDKLQCTAYDGLDSVKTTETREVEYSACRTADGRIWFPSPQGLIMVDPTRVFPNTNAPPAHIESVKINRRECALSGPIVSPPGSGELEVQYTAPTFASPEKQQFRYQLEGYETQWREVGLRRSAFYTNLRPGKYHFLVQAWDPETQCGGATASFDMELLPFFYQTNWFYLLCAAAAILALAGIYAWRVGFLKRKQQAMQAAQDRLETEVQHRTAELRERTLSLEKEIVERKRMQLEVERVHRKLLDASRAAGMAEVATGVLHNVGNALNSVTVSTALVTERTRNFRVALVGKTAALLKEHEGDLEHFLTSDPKGRQLPSFLTELSGHLAREQAAALEELRSLREHVERITEIVAMHQSYASPTGVTAVENIVELLEEALRMHEATLAEQGVTLLREFETSLPPIVVDRHKVLQIVLNLLSNAGHACADSRRDHRQVTVRLARTGERIQISVADNGIGIAPEDLSQIFHQGITTRKNGHGFGLHSGALAAREIGGELRAESAGPGQGATFILELPIEAGRSNMGQS
jgi:ligand-binding sensor domain-containing protein/signal transduction histidine kinase